MHSFTKNFFKTAAISYKNNNNSFNAIRSLYKPLNAFTPSKSINIITIEDTDGFENIQDISNDTKKLINLEIEKLEKYHNSIIDKNQAKKTLALDTLKTVAYIYSPITYTAISTAYSILQEPNEDEKILTMPEKATNIEILKTTAKAQSKIIAATTTGAISAAAVNEIVKSTAPKILKAALPKKLSFIANIVASTSATIPHITAPIFTGFGHATSKIFKEKAFNTNKV